MKRIRLLEEIKRMRFEEIYETWQGKRLTQEEAAVVIGVCSRTFRRYIHRYEEEGLEGLEDRRLDVSSRRAPVDEVLALTERYGSRYRGWNIKHFYRWYARDGGKRSYTWVKSVLQRAGFVSSRRKDPSINKLYNLCSA